MTRRQRVRRSLLQQTLHVLALCVLWILLWDDLSILNIITGIVLGIIVIRMFYLPPIELSGRFNPYYAALFVGWFTASMVIASIEVSWSALRRRGVSAGSVIEIDLHTRSDLLITAVSVVLGLIPGSICIEVDRPHSVIYVHVLDCSTEEAIARSREQIYRIEHLLIATFGSAHDLTVLNEWRSENGKKPVLASRTIRHTGQEARR